MDNSEIPAQSNEDKARLNQESKATILDSNQVIKEIAENGFLTLPAGTKVAVRVAVASQTQNNLGVIYWYDVGSGASQAPTECIVSGMNIKSINSDHPEAATASLQLSSPRLRRLQAIGAEIDAELLSRYPETENDDLSLSARIAETRELDDKTSKLLQSSGRARLLGIKEQQRLAEKLLAQNPDFMSKVQSSGAGKFQMVDASLVVGTTTPIVSDMLRPPPLPPAPAPAL